MLEQFLHDVRDHKLTILKDEEAPGAPDYEDTRGYYRHLRLARPGTICMSYQIISVPYYLTMVGDMGSWTWSRLKDNFVFFRSKREELYINPGYWAEKLQAVDRGGLTEFSEDRYRKRIAEAYGEWLIEERPSREECEKAKAEVRGSLYGIENEQEAHEALREFDSGTSLDAYFQDTWEWTLNDYRPRYIWACYAVAWAIQQYDKEKSLR